MAQLFLRRSFARFGGRYVVGGLYGRGRTRRGMPVRVGCCFGLLLGSWLGLEQQGEHHRAGPLVVDHPRVLFGQRPLPQGVH